LFYLRSGVTVPFRFRVARIAFSTDFCIFF